MFDYSDYSNRFISVNIYKHSYLEKTTEEINAFLTTGQFPERQAANTQQAVNNVAAVAGTYVPGITTTPAVVPAAPQQAPAYAAPTYTQPAVPTTPANVPGSATTAPAPTVPAYTAPAATASTPTRNFSGFSF